MIELLKEIAAITVAVALIALVLYGIYSSGQRS